MCSSLEWYNTIKIASKFNLIISNFKKFLGVCPQTPTKSMLCMLNALCTLRHTIDTLCMRLVGSSQDFYFCLPSLAPSASPLNVAWIRPCMQLLFVTTEVVTTCHTVAIYCHLGACRMPYIAVFTTEIVAACRTVACCCHWGSYRM